MSWRVIAVMAGFLALAADDAADKELKKLQGTWHVSAAEVDGVRIPQTAFQKTTLTIQGDIISWRDGDKVYEEARIKLDPARDPHEIDYHYVQGIKKGVRELGIYTLDGDTLKVCISLTAKKRPAGFSASKGTACQLTILKRARD